MIFACVSSQVPSKLIWGRLGFTEKVICGVLHLSTFDFTWLNLIDSVRLGAGSNKTNKTIWNIYYIHLNKEKINV